MSTLTPVATVTSQVSSRKSANNINKKNMEHCYAEGANGGVIMYIKQDISYKLRND